MKILNRTTTDIPVRDMRDGQIGMITEWGGAPHHVGKIVQKTSYGLISIGDIHNWSQIPDTVNNRVQILPPGTQLEIE